MNESKLNIVQGSSSNFWRVNRPAIRRNDAGMPIVVNTNNMNRMVGAISWKNRLNIRYVRGTSAPWSTRYEPIRKKITDAAAQQKAIYGRSLSNGVPQNVSNIVKSSPGVCDYHLSRIERIKKVNLSSALLSKRKLHHNTNVSKVLYI